MPERQGAAPQRAPMPKANLFEYCQVIGTSDNIIAERLNGVQGLSKEILINCFSSRSTQETLSRALIHELQDDLFEIGVILLNKKYFQEAKEWFQRVDDQQTDKFLKICNQHVNKEW